jgi:hypothetical protein
MGDLNFRLDDVSLSDVKQRIEANELESVQQYDQVGISFISFKFHVHLLGFQLKKAMAAKVILVDFNECPLTCPPTYKCDKGTNVYDSR